MEEDVEDESSSQQQTVPVIEEELVTGTQAVKTGSVRVRKEVERIQKHVDMPVLQDVVKVTRVTVNRPVDSSPKIREEGNVLIIPVVEEEIVVQRRLILKEEIHVHRTQVKSRATSTIELGREHATVERLDENGNVIASSKPKSTAKPIDLGKRRSLLD